MSSILGSVNLTPIASVDTSSAASGVAMFVLTFDQAVIAAGNIIQFEYWQNVVGNPLPATANGFLPLENAVTTQGISNQCTIAIPSLDNTYNYNEDNKIEVKIRVYVGSPLLNEIRVSEWSNTVPLYNAPEQPADPIVFIIKGDDTQSYFYADTLFVHLPNNTSYDKDLIQMVVSYSYKNKDQEFTWVVSEPTPWHRSIYDDDTYNKILIDPITMPTDVGYSDVVYVAVNAIFKYEHNGNNYYTVSQISKTVTAETPEITAPVLNDISIPDDYSVYADKTQKISLSWSPPIADGVPNYTVSNYVVLAYTGANKTLISTSELIASDVTDYEYTIPQTYVTPNTSTLFNFQVKAVYDTGASILSNFENVNTFTYSNAPSGLIVNWANSGSLNTVDLALTFRNPIYTGQGTPFEFVVSVINDSSNTAATQTISYESGINPYTVYFNDVNTTSNGTVSVYLKTQDTNSQEYMNGLSSSTAYQSSDLPLMLSHTNNGITMTSKWVSNTIIDKVCTMIFWNGSALISKPYETVGEHDEYTVTKDNNEPNGDFIYYFTFYRSFFDDDSFFEHGIQCVANSTGIGTGLMTPTINPA